MDYKQWIIDWFTKNSNCGEDIINHLNDNYFERGYIDSFKFIILLSNISDELNIQFDNDKFYDRSFSTINGLIKSLEDSRK